MRLAVLSDIHGNAAALQAVLDDLKVAGGADRTWILGDLCAQGPRPAEVLQMIGSLSATEVIQGNTDRYLATGQRSSSRANDENEWPGLAEKLRRREAAYSWTIEHLGYADYQYLADLRGELEMETRDYGWLIGYHGSPGSDEKGILPDTPADEVLDLLIDREARLAFGGHTHQPMDRELGAWRVVNPGSVGQSFGDRLAWYALVSIENGAAIVELRRVPYDVDAVIADLKQRLFPAIDELEKILLG